MANILLVDDEPEIVFLTKKLLAKKGHNISLAKNGEECKTMLSKETPDLILLDIMMPGADGWEVCRWIKENEKTKDIPVVMFTVRSSKESVKKSHDYAGADAHINKPFKSEELHRVIESVLRG